MKKMVFVFSMFAMFNCFSFEISDDFLNAIMEVESSGKSDAKGDYSNKTKEYRAIGAFQLWKIYIDDVNRFSDKKFKYEDRYDINKSKEIVIIYLKYYGKRYERITGKTATYEILSRIHNGGPNGWKKDSTIKYWNKVMKVLYKNK